MQRTSIIAGLLALILAPLATTAADAPQSGDFLSFQTDDEQNNIEIFKAASPSVVYVTNSAIYRNRFSLNVQEIPQGTGTGFVWNDEGLIVTNAHVIEGASRIRITLNDQSTWDARLVGLARGKDLALLRIDAPKELLSPLPLGDSGDLEVGRKVIAIGNPFGLDTTLTVGVVSALGREIHSLSNRTIRDVIQTDASINPGNSGGPLLNSMGQLIGVNTQILSPSGASAGIGFAIPVNTVKKVVPQLLEFGREVRPVLGIRQLPDHYGQQQGYTGVAIYEVIPGGPASLAGLSGLQEDNYGRLLLGDIITRIGNIRVENNDDLLNAMEQHEPGDEVIVRVRRNQQNVDVSVILAEPPNI